MIRHNILKFILHSSPRIVNISISNSIAKIRRQATDSESRNYGFGIVALLLILGCLVFWIEIDHRFSPIEKHLQSPTLPAAMLDVGSMGTILKKLNLVYIEDDNYHPDQKANKSRLNDVSVGNLFQRKRRIGEYVYRANLGGKHTLPSSTTTVTEHPEIILLSLATTENALYQKDSGILAHPTNSGKQWEKPGALSIYRGRRLISANNIGIRLYGPKYIRAQLTDNPDQGFEVFYRSRYGTEKFDGSLVFGKDADTPVNRLIIEHGDIQKKAIALDIARLAGLEVPGYEPVFLKLNNQLLGVRLVREPVNRQNWIAKTRLKELDFYHYGEGSGDPGWKWFMEMNDWYRRIKGNITMEEAKQYIDIENFTRSMVVFMFCGSNDWQPWAMVRDPQGHPRWKWIVWDLGHCFSDQWATSIGPPSEQHWIKVAVSTGPTNGLWRPTYYNIRTAIFADLLNNDPKYRRYFLQILNQVLNQDLDMDILDQRIQFHRLLLSELHPINTRGQVASIIKIEEFLSNRARFILRSVNQQLIL